jgi:hypothetical protein
MNLFTSRTESSQSTSVYSRNSITKGSSSGSTVRKRVSFHEDVKASKDPYYNNLEDIEETGNQLQYNKIPPTATIHKEGHYYSKLWASYPKIFLIISLITAGFASCLWNRTQHNASQLLIDSNNTITNHGVSPRILTIDIGKERIVGNPNDFKEISLQYLSKEMEDKSLHPTAEIAIIKDTHVTSDLITPILNSYDNELIRLKPLLQQRVAPIYPSKINDNQEENVPQQDSLSEDTITSHQCSIKCLVTFAFLNARANCQGCNQNNKNLNWTNALDSLFMD